MKEVDLTMIAEGAKLPVEVIRSVWEAAFDPLRQSATLPSPYKGRNRLRLSGGLLAACHYRFAQKECRFRARERMTAKLRTPLVAPEIV